MQRIDSSSISCQADGPSQKRALSISRALWLDAHSSDICAAASAQTTLQDETPRDQHPSCPAHRCSRPGCKDKQHQLAVHAAVVPVSQAGTCMQHIQYTNVVCQQDWQTHANGRQLCTDLCSLLHADASSRRYQQLHLARRCDLHNLPLYKNRFTAYCSSLAAHTAARWCRPLPQNSVLCLSLLHCDLLPTPLLTV